MTIDIKTIGTVKHKDGSTEDVSWFDKNFEGLIFETLQGNHYLYREYVNTDDNIYERYGHPFLIKHNQFCKYDYDSLEWEDVTDIIDSITITNNQLLLRNKGVNVCLQEKHLPKQLKKLVLL